MDGRKTDWRESPLPLAPARSQSQPPGQYNLYPGFPLAAGRVQPGYSSLSEALVRQGPLIVLDGFGGVLWERVRKDLDAALAQTGVKAAWQNVQEASWPVNEVRALVEPYLGADDPVFGTRFRGTLMDFFDPHKLQALQPQPEADINILYGTGAALAGWPACLVYFDVPKNEIQYRSRAGSIANLGETEASPPAESYKRFYFVDWPVLNEHKEKLLPELDFFVDEQRPDEITWMRGADLRDGLDAMSENYFRVRPWFEPGVWGGRWSMDKIPQLPSDVPNYAWSFEFISPENGIVFESDGFLLEASFDLLMYHAHRKVLGACASRFGYEFPVRFNFLDTVRGGELAIQCHPRLDYIRQHFGENFTQDESYYILDCEPGSRVYLGFQEGVDPEEFRDELEQSIQNLAPVDIEKYVQVFDTRRHDYYLIPSATVHAAGRNNLVLEISGTPYIFTFKLYDWLVKDLNGELRPLHLDHGFNNLDFRRKGKQVNAELISRPEVVRQQDDWQLVHLPTHDEHFYDVYRFDFNSSFEWETQGSFNVMNLVEGQSIVLETQGGCRQRFNWAETFIVPAAAGRYRLVNEGTRPAKVVMACMKKGAKESCG